MKRMLTVLAAVMTAAASYGAEAVDWLSAPAVSSRTFKLKATDTQLLLEVGAMGMIILVQ